LCLFLCFKSRFSFSVHYVHRHRLLRILLFNTCSCNSSTTAVLRAGFESRHWADNIYIPGSLPCIIVHYISLDLSGDESVPLLAASTYVNVPHAPHVVAIIINRSGSVITYAWMNSAMRELPPLVGIIALGVLIHIMPTWTFQMRYGTYMPPPTRFVKIST
jgi:hypothetical protein